MRLGRRLRRKYTRTFTLLRNCWSCTCLIRSFMATFSSRTWCFVFPTVQCEIANLSSPKKIKLFEVACGRSLFLNFSQQKRASIDPNPVNRSGRYTKDLCGLFARQSGKIPQFYQFSRLRVGRGQTVECSIQCQDVDFSNLLIFAKFFSAVSGRNAPVLLWGIYYVGTFQR